jgi:glycerophosphoryl diester phosphodiesterase
MKCSILFSILGIIALSDFKDFLSPDISVKTDRQLPEPKNIIYVVAHRGAHNGIPENSLAAYRKAIDIGCGFVEIDILTTKDGRFVSIHNSTVDEYTDGIIGKVKDMTLTEL